jgi:hypothetical protein
MFLTSPRNTPCGRGVDNTAEIGSVLVIQAKNGQLRIYQDQDLLATYAEPATKKNLVADPRFYEALRHDKEQIRRKYGRSKGKASRGLANGSLWIDVHRRPLAEYEQYAQGGVAWNS